MQWPHRFSFSVSLSLSLDTLKPIADNFLFRVLSYHPLRKRGNGTIGPAGVRDLVKLSYQGIADNRRIMSNTLRGRDF